MAKATLEDELSTNEQIKTEGMLIVASYISKVFVTDWSSEKEMVSQKYYKEVEDESKE